MSQVKVQIQQGRLQSKVVVVTGASMGIGRALAERAAAEGASVVLGARDAARGEAVAAHIRAKGGTAVFVATDVTVEAQVEALVRKATDRFGRLDGAFNNAGGGDALGAVKSMGDAQWRASLDLNLTSAFYSLKYEIPAMLASGGGSIVNNASVAGVIGIALMPAYVAAKHGLVGLTRAAAMEMATEGVRVNALVTGLVDTPMFRSVIEGKPELEKLYLAAQPGGRAGQPEEVAAFAAFLLSDDSTFINGAALAVDGGATAR